MWPCVMGTGLPTSGGNAFFRNVGNYASHPRKPAWLASSQLPLIASRFTSRSDNDAPSRTLQNVTHSTDHSIRYNHKPSALSVIMYSTIYGTISCLLWKGNVLLQPGYETLNPRSSPPGGPAVSLLWNETTRPYIYYKHINWDINTENYKAQATDENWVGKVAFANVAWPTISCITETRVARLPSQNPH
jgi:hypothetical protein